MKDFFISYNSADRTWAEWIAWQLEEAGYSIVIQAWDFRPGDNFVLGMQKAAAECHQTIAVLSPNYLNAQFTQPEWAAAFVQDPKGEKNILLPVRIKECELTGLLSPIIYIDLVGLGEEAAKNALLSGVKSRRAKPKSQPSFPSAPIRQVKQQPRFPGALPPIWKVSHNRNPNFTGRESLLRDLKNALNSEKSALPIVAIHGLGGVGKTQLATEYAYRYANEHELVWWIRAEDATTLTTDYADLASELNLPEKNAQEQNVVIAAVRRWLDQNLGWLLVFDNADDVDSIRPYLPQGRTGQVLITSRNPNWEDIATPFKIMEFSPAEAVDFLHKRTGQDDEVAAKSLAETLGQLPLALAQAGAYIKNSGRTLADYLELYRKYEQKIFERGKLATGYENTVATTWRISFERVKEQLPAAVDLLNLCAFLAPDNIPRDLLREGIEKLSDTKLASLADSLAFDDAVMALRSYSLIDSTSDTLSIHRLVQAVTRDLLTDEKIKYWIKTTVSILAIVFPSCTGPYDVRPWPTCERLLSHSIVAINHADKKMVASERVAFILKQTGMYLFSRTKFTDAEPLFRRSLEIYEQQLGPDHPDVISSLQKLARVIGRQGNYAEAEQLSRRALEIDEKEYGTDHSATATDLNDLAGWLRGQGKYIEAESLSRRALEIDEKAYGTDHLKTAEGLNNLAKSLLGQDKYLEAELLLRRALKIRERQFGPESHTVATGLEQLTKALQIQGKYAEAEPLLRRGLEIREKHFKPEHPLVATSLFYLALLLKVQGKYAEAEQLLRRALTIDLKAYGSDHEDVAEDLNELALVLQAQARYLEAEPLLHHALMIFENKLNADHQKTRATRQNLEDLLNKMKALSDKE